MAASKFRCPACGRGEYSFAAPCCDYCGVDHGAYLKQFSPSGRQLATDPVTAVATYLEACPNFAYSRIHDGWLWVAGEHCVEIYLHRPYTLNYLVDLLMAQGVPNVRPRHINSIVVRRALLNLYLKGSVRQVATMGRMVPFVEQGKVSPGLYPIRDLGPNQFYYYLGTEITPKRNPALVTQFLNSLFLKDARDRRAFYQFLAYGLVRPLYLFSRCPFMLIAAAANEQGKTTLADAYSLLLTGELAVGLSFDVYMNVPERVINQFVTTRVPVILFDNVPGDKLSYYSERFADFITRSQFTTYRLGVGGNMQRYNDLIFIVTSNNPILTDELASRAYMINAYCVSKAKKKEILDRLRANRSELMGALLWEVQHAWQKQPPPVSCKTRFSKFAELTNRLCGGFFLPSVTGCSVLGQAILRVFDVLDAEKLPVSEIKRVLTMFNNPEFVMARQDQQITEAKIKAESKKVGLKVNKDTVERRQ